VTLTGTRADALSALAQELGNGAHVAVADLSAPEAADRLVKQAETAMSRVDIVINNAGFARDGLSLRLRDEDWETVLAVNLTAAFRVTRAALRGMVRRRHGRVVYISSVVGLTGNAGQANYAASKAALIGMAKSIAAEVAARGVTVNCVAPGLIATAMTDRLGNEQLERIARAIPMDRLGTPDEVAAAVLFLASPEAAYVTGQTLHVNGGLAMI
jgi:3-oxoacyl-[acyl-carrier protein] reductase